MIHSTHTTFRLILALSAISLGITAEAQAACTSAKVTMISQNAGTCGGRVGFVSSTSGGSIICTGTALQGDIVLAAYLAGKTIKYQLGSGDNDCNPNGSETLSKSTVWVQAI